MTNQQHSEGGGRPDAARHYYRAAVHTAVIAGVFCLVVAAQLLRLHVREWRSGLRNSPEMTRLKDRLAATDNDRQKAELVEQIRELDVKLRREHLQARSQARSGGYLLAGGAVVLIASLSVAMSYRKKLPMPQPVAQQEGDANAPLRRGVGAAGVAVGCALLLAAVLARRMPGEYEVGARAAKAGAKANAGNGEPEGITTAQRQAGYPSDEEVVKNWPSFRGPNGAATSAYHNVPSSWNGQTGENVLWKAEIPLPGQNSPVVWGNRIFLTGADAKNREVYCFDADSGKLLWRKAVATQQETPDVMQDTGYAAPTAATDGRRVCAMFATGDVVCFDYNGNQLWRKALGKPENAYGHASSLVMHEGTVIVLLDQGYSAEEGLSAIIGLDAATGEEQWRTRRDVPNSWASPVVIKALGLHQVITCGDPWVIAYDPETGSEIWRAEVLSGDVAPSPAFAGGVVFVCNTGACAAAIDPNGTGNVTETNVLWKNDEHDPPDICSPLSDGSLLFMVSTWGTVYCHDATTGEQLWEHDFESEFNSSPSLVGSNVYLTDKQGVTHMFEAAREFSEVGTAELGEGCTASPAFADGRIYIRGSRHLFCIGKK